MEPQQQPRSTPPPPTTPPPPPQSAAGKEASPPPVGAGKDTPPPLAGNSAAVVTVCPSCGEPRAEDARFCEECGHDYGGAMAPEAEERSFLSGPALWVFMLFWVALAIAGLWYLFTLLWAA